MNSSLWCHIYNHAAFYVVYIEGSAIKLHVSFNIFNLKAIYWLLGNKSITDFELISWIINIYSYVKVVIMINWN